MCDHEVGKCMFKRGKMILPQRHQTLKVRLGEEKKKKSG